MLNTFTLTVALDTVDDVRPVAPPSMHTVENILSKISLGHMDGGVAVYIDGLTCMFWHRNEIQGHEGKDVAHGERYKRCRQLLV